MTWFKVSDGLAFHRKALAAGNEALGAWVRAGAWSSAGDNLTEGYIPPEVATAIAPPKVWARLRAAGLTEAPSDGRPGEQLHDFLVYNPTAGAVKEDREATRKRVESWREKRRSERSSNTSGNAVTPDVTNGVATGVRTPAPSRPVPSRPVHDPDPPLPPAGGSAAPTGAPSEPKPEKRAKGPSAEQRYREAFVAGIHEGAPGQPYALGGRIGSTLGPALAEHAREGGSALVGDALDAWIRVTVARWRRTADAAYAGGWSVFAFVKWLNAGQPAGLLNGSRVSTVQPVPATGRLWKMGEEV